MNESKLAKKFMNKLKSALPPEAVIFRHCEQFTRGVPDYSVTLGGRTVWIEFKVQGGKLSAIQKKHLELMENIWIVWFGLEWCGQRDEDWKMLGILDFLRRNRE